MRFSIHADGGARGNPGKAGAGAVVRSDGKVVAEISEFLGHTTNNVAEYTAVIRALETCARLAGREAAETEIDVKMDSELVVRQMKGEYKVKHPNLKPLATHAKALVSLFREVTFAHIPREKNADADALANEAMDRGS